MDAGLLVPIFFFGGISLVLWKHVDSRHKERMTIIEKGLVSEDLKYLYGGIRLNIKTHPFSSLKFGLLALFIGVGILISAFLSQMFFGHEEQITAGVIFLFGGLGLIAFYAIANKRIAEMEKEKKE